jgi:hypothetical protein
MIDEDEDDAHEALGRHESQAEAQKQR